MRSQIASAMVASPMAACQSSGLSWLVTMVEASLYRSSTISSTRLASVLAPILELLDETGGLTHDEALAQLQDEVGQLRSLVMGKPLRYKVVDALNQQVKRLPFLHRALKAPLSTRGPKL